MQSMSALKEFVVFLIFEHSAFKRDEQFVYRATEVLS